jgi:hypothetical protein
MKRECECRKNDPILQMSISNTCVIPAKAGIEFAGDTQVQQVRAFA